MCPAHRGEISHTERRNLMSRPMARWFIMGQQADRRRAIGLPMEQEHCLLADWSTQGYWQYQDVFAAGKPEDLSSKWNRSGDVPGRCKARQWRRISGSDGGLTELSKIMKLSNFSVFWRTSRDHPIRGWTLAARPRKNARHWPSPFLSRSQCPL